MDVGAWVRKARQNKRLTQEQLGEHLSVTKGNVSGWENGRHEPSYSQLLRISQLTGTPLENGAREPQPEYAGTRSQVRRVAIVGTARMGDNGYYDEISSVPGAGDGHIDIATADEHAYGLRVRGNSMEPAIRDGWYVLVEPNGQPALGEYVLIKLRDGQRMVKELLYQRPGSIEIMSVNGGERRTIYHDEIESLQAVAAVVSPSKWKPD